MLNKWGPEVETKFAAVFPENRFKVELQQKTTVDPVSGGRQAVAEKHNIWVPQKSPWSGGSGRTSL